MKGYKLCVLGFPGVGKTAMAKRYETGEFIDNYKTTIGLEIITKNVEIEGEEVKLSIWDIAGTTKFETIEKDVFKEMHGCIIVYDITNRRSFDDLHIWTNRLIDNHDIISKYVIKILVGNKKDLNLSRQVYYDETREYWERSAIQTYETSAKTGENIDKVFSDLITDIYNSHNRR